MSKAGAVLFFIGFGLSVVGMFKGGLALARRDTRRKQRMLAEAADRKRLAAVVPDSLREPLYPRPLVAAVVLASVLVAAVAGRFAGSAGVILGFAVVFLPGYLYLDRPRERMRRTAISRGRAMAAAMTKEEHDALMLGLYAMYDLRRYRQQRRGLPRP
jgi:uncharacterized membrane protein